MVFSFIDLDFESHSKTPRQKSCTKGAFGRAPADSGSHTVAHCSVQELEPEEQKKTSFSGSGAVSERGKEEREKRLR